MRILVLCTDAYGGYGGIALHARDLIEAIAAHPRVDEVVVLPRLVPREPEPPPVKVRFVAAAARGTAAYVREVLRAGRRFDLVVCTHINLVPIARLLRRPAVTILHGIEAWKPLPRTPARVLDGLDGVICVSAVTRERFLSWSCFRGPAFVLPNAIHLERFGIRAPASEIVERWGLRGKRVLLTFGRMVAAERYKGFDEVIEVLPSLPGDVVYLAAGSGSDLPRLRAKAQSLGLDGRVVFTGYIEEQEKIDVYNLADVYVMPSRGEGFGFVLLEALACGVPVIGSRHDGTREALLGGELGRLVDPSSPAEIRTAILDVLAEHHREIPPGLAHFAFANFQSRVHSLLDELTA